jgi:sodium/potassium-transporting ATPase subunit alpha
MAIRTRTQSILSHPPMFKRQTSNYFLFPAIIFALVIAILFLYPKKFNDVLGTSPIPVQHWFLPMAFGMGILLLDEGRKYMLRSYPKGIVAKLAW